MTKLKAPEGCASCSHDGETYETDADGIVTVPAEAVEALLSHGFAAADAPETEADAAVEEAVVRRRRKPAAEADAAVEVPAES